MHNAVKRAGGCRLGWKIPAIAAPKALLSKTGLAMTGIPVDDEGMCWEGLCAPSPTLIFTSPSHQFPYGSVLSARRRLALLELARQHNAWIIEDDYDSEFRYTGEPVPAMLVWSTTRPLCIWGRSAKRCFRRSEWGSWCYRQRWRRRHVPPSARCCAAGIALNSAPSALFIEEGHYARHLAAMRRLYRKRYRQLREVLSAELHTPHRVLAGEGGMHRRWRLTVSTTSGWWSRQERFSWHPLR